MSKDHVNKLTRDIETNSVLTMSVIFQILFEFLNRTKLVYLVSSKRQNDHHFQFLLLLFNVQIFVDSWLINTWKFCISFIFHLIIWAIITLFDYCLPFIMFIQCHAAEQKPGYIYEFRRNCTHIIILIPIRVLPFIASFCLLKFFCLFYA